MIRDKRYKVPDHEQTKMIHYETLLYIAKSGVSYYINDHQNRLPATTHSQREEKMDPQHRLISHFYCVQ